MTIAGVHDTTLNTGIMSGPISRLGIRQHSPAMQSAECGVHYWDYTDQMSGVTPAACVWPSIVTWSLVSEIILFSVCSCLLIVMWGEDTAGQCPGLPRACCLRGLNFIRYSTGNQDTAPAASSWDPSDHQTVGGLFSFIIFLKMEERI